MTLSQAMLLRAQLIGAPSASNAPWGSTSTQSAATQLSPDITRDRRPTLTELLGGKYAPRAPEPKLTPRPREFDLRGVDLAAVPGATDQFGFMQGGISMRARSCGILYDWRPVLLFHRPSGLGTAHIVGVHQEREEWVVTTRILASAETLAAQSRCGVYLLGTPGCGDLSAAMCEVVRRAVYESGIAHEVTLDVGRYAGITRGRFKYEEEPDASEGPRKSPTASLTIDGLARRNGHLTELGIATPEEIEPIVADVRAGDQSTDLTTWRILAIRDPSARTTSLHLLCTRPLCPDGWVSAPVDALSPDRTLCQVGGSVYALGKHFEGPLGPYELMVVTRALRNWHLDEELGLDAVMPEEILHAFGVPRVRLEY